jgi:serine/threonine protein kinase
MDYIEGMTLEKYINSVTGPIPSEVAIAMIKEIASAIGYAHHKEIPIP